MSQTALSNGDIEQMDTSSDSEAKNSSNSGDGNGNGNQTATHQPNVRHIPIFVEGRDQPLYNNLDTTPSMRDVPKATGINPTPSMTKSPLYDIPHTNSSLLDRCKDIPVKKIIPEFHSNKLPRSESPAHTIPIKVIHEPSNLSQSPRSQQSQQQQQQQNNNGGAKQKPMNFRPENQVKKNASKEKQIPIRQEQNSQQDLQQQRAQSPRPPPQPVDPITKIQAIQKEVLELMDKVEKYEGGTKKDKEYVYLDEMLTQNLLKLDTIDTEGKENVKAARKEAINCINKCIQVLEAKADSSNKQQSENSEKTSKDPEDNKKMSQNSQNVEKDKGTS